MSKEKEGMERCEEAPPGITLSNQVDFCQEINHPPLT